MTTPVIHPDTVTYVLVKHAKHRNGNPYVQELKRYLENPVGEYFFLSSDYYASFLKVENGIVTLRVDSADEKVLERVSTANEQFTSALV